MTAREFARRLEVPYTTVAGWLQKGQVPGAEAQVVGTFKVWMIPVSALKDFKRPDRGRPKKSKDQPKTSKKTEEKVKATPNKKTTKKLMSVQEMSGSDFIDLWEKNSPPSREKKPSAKSKKLSDSGKKQSR